MKSLSERIGDAILSNNETLIVAYNEEEQKALTNKNFIKVGNVRIGEEVVTVYKLPLPQITIGEGGINKRSVTPNNPYKIGDIPSPYRIGDISNPDWDAIRKFNEPTM